MELTIHNRIVWNLFFSSLLFGAVVWNSDKIFLVFLILVYLCIHFLFTSFVMSGPSPENFSSEWIINKVSFGQSGNWKRRWASTRDSPKYFPLFSISSCPLANSWSWGSWVVGSYLFKPKVTILILTWSK